MLKNLIIVLPGGIRPFLFAEWLMKGPLSSNPESSNEMLISSLQKTN